MSRLKLYFHGGSSNHGCEAIVRSTSKIIDSDIDLFSTASQEDIFYNLSEIVNVYNDNDEILTIRGTCINKKKEQIYVILSIRTCKVITTYSNKYWIAQNKSSELEKYTNDKSIQIPDFFRKKFALYY